MKIPQPTCRCMHMIILQPTCRCMPMIICSCTHACSQAEGEMSHSAHQASRPDASEPSAFCCIGAQSQRQSGETQQTHGGSLAEVGAGAAGLIMTPASSSQALSAIALSWVLPVCVCPAARAPVCWCACVRACVFTCRLCVRATHTCARVCTCVDDTLSALARGRTQWLARLSVTSHRHGGAGGCDSSTSEKYDRSTAST
mgnify:CR=1 FL=1